MSDNSKREKEQRKRDESPHEYHTSDDTVRKHYFLSLIPVIGPSPPGQTSSPATPTSARSRPKSPRRVRSSSQETEQQIKNIEASIRSSHPPKIAKGEVPKRVVQPMFKPLALQQHPFPQQSEKRAAPGAGATSGAVHRKEAQGHPFVASLAPNRARIADKVGQRQPYQKPVSVDAAQKGSIGDKQKTAALSRLVKSAPHDVMHVKHVPKPGAEIRKTPPTVVDFKAHPTVPEAATPQSTGRRAGTEAKQQPPSQEMHTPAAAQRDTITESLASLATVAEELPKTVLFCAPIEEPLFEALTAGRHQPTHAPKSTFKYEHPKVPFLKPDIAERLRKLQALEEESTPPSQVSFATAEARGPHPDFPEENLPTAPTPPRQEFDMFSARPFRPEEKAVHEESEKLPRSPIPTIVIEPPIEEAEAPAPPQKEPESEPQKFNLASMRPEPKPKSVESISKLEAPEKGGWFSLAKKPKSKEMIPKSPSNSMPELKNPKSALKKSPSDSALAKSQQSKAKRSPLEIPKLREALPQFGEYGIPDQHHLLDVLLDGDLKIDDFGGFLRAYFSPSLRSFALLNLQGRYRGAENPDCLKTIDIEKMASKDDAEAATRARNLEKREQELEGLRAAAKDEEHFQFLKGFANMQAVTFPITVSHGLLQETVPMLDEIFHFYIDNLGQDHKSTIEAGEHFVRHRNRLNMYDNL